MPQDIYQLIQDKKAQREKFAIATVIQTSGSASAKTASKAVIDVHGVLLLGWVGGGCAESSVCEQAKWCIENNQTIIIDIDLDDEMLGAGMPCGGNMTVYIEPVIPNPILWILGHGKVAETLCELASIMDFAVVINDSGATWNKFPNATKIITDDMDYELLTPTHQDYVVIATQHKGDHESLQVVLNTDVQYIGLIASQKRAGLVIDYLRELAISQEAIDRVKTPCGLRLNAQTPQEIALSIISEIVAIRRESKDS
jgi:xanthine dehydrogenase accessory factor